jgi:hypothetical protein
MTDTPLITIAKRDIVALTEALKLARYALRRSGRSFDCPPHGRYSVAHTLDLAIARGIAAQKEVRS